MTEPDLLQEQMFLLIELERASRKSGIDESEIWQRNVISKQFRRSFSLAWLCGVAQLLISIALAQKPFKPKAKAAIAALRLAMEVHHDWTC